MKIASKTLALTAIAAAVLGGCGGGGDDPQVVTEDGRSLLVGTAAYGAAMAGAKVTVVDTAGKTATVTADAQGHYLLNLPNFVAPLLVTAEQPSGEAARVYHTLVATSPAPGTSVNANVTPLTDAIVALVSSDGASPAEFESPAKLAALDRSRLERAAALIQSAISGVAAQFGVPQFDPVSTAFTAAHGAGGDQLLEAVKVSYGSDGVTLRNAFFRIDKDFVSPAFGSVLTIKDWSASLSVLRPSEVSSGPVIDDFVAQVNKCLALAPEQRVTLADGKPAALQGDCAKISGFTRAYRRNGHSMLEYWGQQFRDVVPAGAVMQAPELIALTQDETGQDTALVRLAYNSPQGGGSYVETLRRVDTAWQVDGNQLPYDADITVRVMRSRDVSALPFVPASGPDANKEVGWFDAMSTRMHFGFNQSGPNAADVYAVRVTGPGLPAEGLVLARSTACGTSDYLAVYSNDGSLPPAPPAGTAIPLATSLTRNAYVLAVAPEGDRYKGSDFYNEWRGRNADGTPYTGKTSSIAPAPGVATSTIPPLAPYRYEVFRAGSSTAAAAFTLRIVSQPVSPQFAARLPFASLTADTMKYLTADDREHADDVDSLLAAWQLPERAPAVHTVSVFGNGTDASRVYHTVNATRRVAKLGDTSLQVPAAPMLDGNGQACSYALFPSVNSISGYREIGTRQSMLDGLSLGQMASFTRRAADGDIGIGQ